MKKIEAVIKPHKLDEVKEALHALGVHGHDRVRGQGLRPPEGPHRDLPRHRVHRRLRAEDQDRGRRGRRPGAEGRTGHRRRGPHRQDRRRQGLHATTARARCASAPASAARTRCRPAPWRTRPSQASCASGRPWSPPRRRAPTPPAAVRPDRQGRLGTGGDGLVAALADRGRSSRSAAGAPGGCCRSPTSTCSSSPTRPRPNSSRPSATSCTRCGTRGSRSGTRCARAATMSGRRATTCRP